LNYEVAIDHALVEHLGRTAKAIGVDQDATIKMHQAVYFYKVKGYLSAADLIKEVAANKQSTAKIASSE